MIGNLSEMTHAEKLTEWQYRFDEHLGTDVDGTREALKLEIMRAEIYADSVVKF